MHPTRNSLHLFEILQGKYVYVKGQTLYAGLRSSGVFSRQIFIHLYKSALDAISYDDLLSDWSRFEQLFKNRWEDQNDDSVIFRKSTFQSWASTLRLTVEKTLLNTIYQVLHSQFSLSYQRFVDWAVTIGIVPLAECTPDTALLNSLTHSLETAIAAASGSDLGLRTMTRGLLIEMTHVVRSLTSRHIPDHTDVIIQYNGKAFKAYYRGRPIKFIVLARPTLSPSGPMFDSPVQRLFCSIMACYRTQEHAKICQLINTAPVKGITSQSSNSDLYKDILSKIEESSQKSNPKKDLLQLLVKLAENKTVSGITDVVEEFITDVSQNMVDKSKLFGGGVAETTKQTLKKQVSGSVFKCLTNQINEQFETINGLQRERELFIKRIELLESKMLRDDSTATTGTASPPSSNCLITGDTLTSLREVTHSDLTHKFVELERGGHLNNSFLSQYVPAVDDMIKELTGLWENEILQTFKLTPVVDNQGQRLYVKYSQDTITQLIGPFTFLVAGLSGVELITEDFSSLNLREIGEEVYRTSRLAVYVGDVGSKYCNLRDDERACEAINWGGVISGQPHQRTLQQNPGV